MSICCLIIHFLPHAVNNNKKALAGSLLILVVSELICFMIYYSKLLSIEDFIQSKHTTLTKQYLSAVSALIACVDTALASSIAILLHRHRRKSKALFSRTRSIIDRIMIYTVGSGIVTATFAVAGFITSLTMPKNFVYIMLLHMLPKRESVSLGMLTF